MSDLSGALGVAVLFVSIGVGGLTLFLLRGKARLSEILSAFAQVTIVPKRRRQFLVLLWVVVVCFLVTGILLGLYRLGVQLTGDPDLLFSVSFLVGMIALGAWVWVGLSPRPLTELERATAEDDAPAILESLWTVPYQRMDDPRPRRRQP